MSNADQIIDDITAEVEPVAEVKASIKLKKAEKEFFGDFAANAVSNILAPILEYKGVDITNEQVTEVIKTLDLSVLTQAIGQAFLERVAFKDIVKVDKFMKSEEFQSVVLASTEVNAMVQGELIQIVAPLIPADPVEPTEEELADLAS
jgi:hypothetical protein